ncbi:DUF1385 domain-containing protein [Neobacillus niacini]|uniref:DUF1385 domain-containing protein n=1 Tax=Neobacillus niacini TaxID=86668 RepID=UPI0007AC0DB7|nr:DUF1385 domain-containing protein [Neobacillus niacini]MEC1524357.1 DUF1385 domain-containing protein [Neobacillus niacini]
MSIIKGGAAGFNSVVFYSENFSSRAIRKSDGAISIEIIKRKIASKYERFIKRIPLIRGLFLFIQPIVTFWKVYLITCFLLIFVLLLSRWTSNDLVDNSSFSTITNSLYIAQKHFLQALAIIIVIFAVVIKLSNLGKYHAAEHMTDSSFESLKSLSISNIAKQSRIHNNCGTNLVVFLFVIYSILSLFISDFFVLIMLTICLAYEVFLLESTLLVPFYWIGGISQYLLFTSKPSKEHLEVATAAYKALVIEERNKRNG